MKWLLVLLVVLLVACQQPITQPEPTEDVPVERFSSESELLSFIEEHQSGDFGGGVMRRAMSGVAVMESVAMDVAVSPSKEFSETNVQVAGIDEADILKTDGDFIYTITEQTVFIITEGSDAEVVSTIDFDQPPSGMFLDGDRLAVFGNFYDVDWFKSRDIRPSVMTFFNIYDISNREKPKLVKEFKFEGNYFQGRMTDGWVYLIVTSRPEIRPRPMPIIVEGDVVRNVPISDIAYYPLPYNNVQFATVHAIDIESEEVNSQTVAVDGAQNMYMSYENIYLTSTEWVNEWSIRQDIQMELLEPELTTADTSLIKKIESVEPAVLSKNEKRQKIYNVYNRYLTSDSDFEDEVEEKLKKRMQEFEATEYTIVHKLSVDGGDITIGTSGKVPGTINNQFSMDEYENVFRVATTLNNRNRWWAEPMDVEEMVVASPEPSEKMMIAPPMPRPSDTTNNIYTFDANMNRLDELTGLADGERIFSTRFIKDRLYMVTFRQVDPFFVIDLSDPSDIKELGELKIPGFSRYLHPYDDNFIIGIGRDASETGRQQGIKVSLFNVENVAKPKEVASWVADEKYSQTSAEWEHKAFLFSREKSLLVIPAYNYEYDWRDDRGQGYNGAMVFHIDTDEIEMRGIIDHSDGEQRYSQQVERSLWIDDLLYTKSPYLLRVNEISTLEGVQDVELKASKSGPYSIY